MVLDLTLHYYEDLSYTLPMHRNFDPKNIKALALDLDGTTLKPDTTFGERTRLCIRELISKGMRIIIATGRAIEASERFRSAMGAEGPMVFFNGAEVVDMPSRKVLHANFVSIDAVDYGADIARSLGVHYQVYLPAGISPDTGKEDPNQKWEPLLIDNYGPEAEMYYNYTGIVPVVTDLKRVAALPDLKECIKGMFIADPSFHDEIRKRIYDRFGDQVHVLRSYPNFLEIINKGVSKGEGLKVAIQHLEIKAEEVIAFGDEENDLSMFEAAGFCAAPENARDKIKEAADLVYGSTAQEGLAQYLEKVFL